MAAPKAKKEGSKPKALTNKATPVRRSLSKLSKHALLNKVQRFCGRKPFKAPKSEAPKKAAPKKKKTSAKK